MQILSVALPLPSIDIVIPKSFREAGYDIVYMDETWVNQNHCTDYMWLPNDGSDAPKIPSGKGKRLIVFTISYPASLKYFIFLR
jgi:hypothetical protein